MSLMHPAIWKEIKKKFSLQYLRKPSGLYHILPFAVYPSNQVFYLQIQVRLATCIKKKKKPKIKTTTTPQNKNPTPKGYLEETVSQQAYRTSPPQLQQDPCNLGFWNQNYLLHKSSLQEDDLKC